MMNKKYNVLLADPPWKFKTYSQKGLGRSAEAWYDCMDVDDICAMQVERYANTNCVLFLWATDPFLAEAFRVIDAWGFKYRTVGFYWVKQKWSESAGRFIYPIGNGYWTRANPEQCLLAVRGNPKRIDASVPKLILAPRREHSRKPDEAYSSIEKLCTGPYLELFARQQWPGWDCLGNENDLFSNNEKPKRRWGSGSYPGK